MKILVELYLIKLFNIDNIDRLYPIISYVLISSSRAKDFLQIIDEEDS